MATPHFDCEPGAIAPLVLMPGDPKRANRIAAQFLADAQLVSEVRGIPVWTGTYQGVPMSVSASGMGIPSISIYATELFRFYGVKRICRVGTCGGISSDVKVRDVIIGMGAHTNSAVSTLPVPGATLSLTASFDMLRGAVDAARAGAATVHIGSIYSSDFFYSNRTDIVAGLNELGVLGVEMEAAGLYACALSEGAQALAVLTVSDHLFDSSADMTAAERETKFVDAVHIAAAGLLA